MSNIFDSLWVLKYNPTSFDEVVLSPSNRDYFNSIKQAGIIPHLLFCSPPGSGKSTLAKLIPKELDVSYLYINASNERGIDTIREKVLNYAQTKSLDGKFKIIILDEMDGLTGDAQRALRDIMEEYNQNVRFILTANYKNRITKPILSRAQMFELVPPLKGCTTRIVEILKKENVVVPADQKDNLRALISSCYPDLRKSINSVHQNVRNGIFSVDKVAGNFEVAEKIHEMLRKKATATDIRKYVIDNEVDFGNDYQVLLKGLFEVVFADGGLKEDQKRQALLIIGNALYKHQFVLDFEINAYCCILELQNVL